MKKFPKIGKRISLPAAALAIACLASGSVKTEATPSLPSPAEFAARGIAVTLAHPEPLPALRDFCNQYWGEISEDASYCRFEQTFHVNLSHAGRTAVQTPIQILAGDTVNMQARFAALARVSGVRQEKAPSFQANVSGYLSLQPHFGQSFFSVQQISVERCFRLGPSGQMENFACPAIVIR